MRTFQQPQVLRFVQCIQNRGYNPANGNTGYYMYENISKHKHWISLDKALQGLYSMICYDAYHRKISTLGILQDVSIWSSSRLRVVKYQSLKWGAMAIGIKLNTSLSSYGRYWSIDWNTRVNHGGTADLMVHSVRGRPVNLNLISPEPA